MSDSVKSISLLPIIFISFRGSALASVGSAESCESRVSLTFFGFSLAKLDYFSYNYLASYSSGVLKKSSF